MDVPYEYLNLLKKEKSILLTLPDGMHTTGLIAKIMPSVDPVSQTVKVLVKVANKDIPENLVATVTFTKTKTYGLCIPKAAVVTDETQSAFWVMKMMNDSTAVSYTHLDVYKRQNYICGVVDTALVFLEAPETQNTNLSFESSVYREAFVADSLQLANKAALILYDYKPKISAFTDAGYQSSFISAPYKNLGFSLGIAVSLSLIHI